MRSDSCKKKANGFCSKVIRRTDEGALADSSIMPLALAKLGLLAVQKIAGTLSELSGVIKVLGLRTLSA